MATRRVKKKVLKKKTAEVRSHAHPGNPSSPKIPCDTPYEPAVVTISMGMTLNIGDYENVKIEAGVQISCTQGEIEATQERAKLHVMRCLSGNAGGTLDALICEIDETKPTGRRAVARI